MNQDPIRVLVAATLAAYGVYAAGIASALIGASSATIVLLLFLVEAALAFAATVGVWRRLAWAAPMVVVLGVVIAAKWLYQGFILGIVAYLYALLAAVLAVVIALLIAACLSGRLYVSVSRRGAQANYTSTAGSSRSTRIQP